MRALTWHNTQDVRVDNVADPEIEQSRDAIIKVTATAICGSDLHLYNGVMGGMQAGDVLGHEFMGEVVETGADVPNLDKGDRVAVPSTIACGHCFFCNHNLYSLCDESNPNADQAAEAIGHSPSALFGYSHMLGGIPGGQAEYVRVPYADIGPLKVESDYSDEQLLFLSDIYPTGWMGANKADIEPGDTVAVWGCGPVGQFAIRSAWMLGAGRVIAVDRVPERLQLAPEKGGVEVINFEEADVYESLQAMTRGYGPDRCVDAVGAEAHGAGNPDYEKREADEAQASRPGRRLFAACADVNKGLSLKSGQTHMQLLKTIEKGLIDPSFIITHRLKLDDAPDGYVPFNAKQDNCIKVVLTP